MSDEKEQAPVIHSIRDYMKERSIQNQPIIKPVSGVAVHKPDTIPRLLVVSRVHHREHNGQVKFITSRFGRELVNNDDPFFRKFVVGEEWIPLDTAWVKDVGYLCIQNLGGKPFQVIPTTEQMQEAKGRIIEVGHVMAGMLSEHPEGKSNKRTSRTMFDPPQLQIVKEPIVQITPLWLIYPGESMQGAPCNQTIFLRCRSGEVTVNVMATPN